jgi:FkbM family methyltransferase
MYRVALDCQVVGLSDLYAKHFPDESYRGVFVEVGAFNGYNYSNVFGLAEHGWKGLCIEANPISFGQLESFYSGCPDVKCVQIATGKPGKAKLYLEAAISTVSEEQYTLYKKHNWARGSESFVEIQKVPLNIVLKENDVENIDVFSLDIEGSEYEALGTFDIDYYMPKMAIVEAHENHPLEGFGRYAKDINEYFLKRKYKIIYSDVINNIYLREDL